MSVVFVMAPIALLLAAVFVGAFIWASRDGQFDDTDTPAHRVLLEEKERDEDRADQNGEAPRPGD